MTLQCRSTDFDYVSKISCPREIFPGLEPPILRRLLNEVSFLAQSNRASTHGISCSHAAYVRTQGAKFGATASTVNWDFIVLSALSLP